MSVLWVLMALGCGGSDPALVAQRDAIAEWRLGQRAMQEGDLARARLHFQEARTHRPRDGLLHAWEARAAAEQGDLDAAIGLLEEGLALQPAMAEARYNLAAYLVRDERHSEAAPHLALALEAGAFDPREVLDDPDFAAVQAHPDFGFLPRSTLEAELVVPESAVFWGTQTIVALEFEGAEAPEITGALEGPVELVSGRLSNGRMEWTFVPRGAGELVVGPIEVRADQRSISVASRAVELTAPPDKPSFDSRRITLESIRSLRGDLDVPGVRGGTGEVVVVALPGQKVEVTPQAGRLQRFELREGERTAWLVHRRVGLEPGDYEAVVRAAGGEVLRQTVSVAAADGPPG